MSTRSKAFIDGNKNDKQAPGNNKRKTGVLNNPVLEAPVPLKTIRETKRIREQNLEEFPADPFSVDVIESPIKKTSKGRQPLYAISREANTSTSSFQLSAEATAFVPESHELASTEENMSSHPLEEQCVVNPTVLSSEQAQINRDILSDELKRKEFCRN